MRTPLDRLRVNSLAGRLYAVTGDSMGPSFEPGDLVLVDRMAYRTVAPERGDAVIVRDPTGRGQRYLKRVVGLPGEEVLLAEGMLFIDGRQMAEPYLGGLPSSLGLRNDARVLGDDEYFVMGDNRAHSTDSREFGPIGKDLILGKARFRCWPLRRWGALSGTS